MAKAKGKKTLSTDQKLDLLLGRLAVVEKANGIEFVEPVNPKILCLVMLTGSCGLSETSRSDSTTVYVREQSYYTHDEEEDDSDFEAVFSVYAEDIKDAYQHYCHYIRRATLGEIGLGDYVGTWMYRTKDGKEEWPKTVPLINPNNPTPQV